ncbi:MAG: hypothetical protein UX08_C0013G0019 [Candidatus Collierbacteria bacterium GW2011_GWB1_45_35]|uniref:Uncharacterized protein n=2 Tax=Candidatus Collieribacteriota TaxID=1752725 RepID=A0A0G1KT59_9BACT|nr:MAG: hypothetical protein UW48_C0008G0019 [Microgenomates group bacterium GW2011_GWC1_44_23]KKT86690.1 MAG: hypothetical protein UW84_C0004G0005 [Candidatus Collierbacteria bacterium GW2011_GWA2_44_99]KKT95352.1 MAG: hypothetical protein UW96_C0008G0019 [Candidatus Collierbacteria bacterium GW2011_GWA1_45_15]KKT99597.1 MAG: hypothetical protein UX01_C0009G0027 [Candidatus Collierbacteria bacterium GW2011_GWB2_45_17]KKU04929.1 MAG: hypothetical protein UX08_C0013G0019 [Candidatus Collierbacte
MADFASSVVVNHALYVAMSRAFGTVDWKPSNDFQRMVVRHSLDSLLVALQITSDQLFSKAAHDAETVNRFLRENEFALQLQDMGSGPKMAYVASILKLLGKFYERGLTGYHLPKAERPAFRLGNGAGTTHFDAESKWLVRIPTDGGFDFWLTSPNHTHGFSMIDDWISMLRVAKLKSGSGVILPMVTIAETSVDISRLVGMTSGEIILQQALAAAKFALTPEFVKFEMAAAMSAKRGWAFEMRPLTDDYVADHALYFALALRDMSPLMPLAVGMVDMDEFSRTELH